MDASFKVKFLDFTKVKESTSDLQRLTDSMRIAFLDNRGIGGME